MPVARVHHLAQETSVYRLGGIGGVVAGVEVDHLRQPILGVCRCQNPNEAMSSVRLDHSRRDSEYPSSSAHRTPDGAIGFSYWVDSRILRADSRD
jgi:hypothetical protein